MKAICVDIFSFLVAIGLVWILLDRASVFMNEPLTWDREMNIMKDAAMFAVLIECFKRAAQTGWRRLCQ